MTKGLRHVDGGVLVLDFDGVLCDSIEECTLIAYLAHEGSTTQRFVDPGLAGVPEAVIDRVRDCRPFIRHLGHFLVPLVDARPPSDSVAFAARYARIPPAHVEAFVSAASSLRAAVRRTYEARWLAHHRVEPRLVALAAGAYIATARDAVSVRRILRSHGVQFDEARIFHSLRDKTRALRSIASLESVLPTDVRLVDDSIENCLAATAAGYTADWASWGYHAPVDAEIAREHGIRRLTVVDLIRDHRSTLENQAAAVGAHGSTMNDDRPKLAHLRSFLYVARLHSLSRAAVELSVSQPTITEHIKQLEKGYGQRLFDRGRGTLTPEGEALRRMVESSIDRLDSLTFDEKPMEAHVGLGGPPDLLSLRALPALAPLYAEGVNIRVRPGLAEDLITHLENGTLDMFIATRRIESEVVEVRYLPLFAEEYVLVGNRDWFDRVRGNLDPEAADDEVERSIADGLSRAQFLAFDGDLPLIRDHPLILRHQRAIFDADRLRRVPLIMPDLRGLCEAAIAGAGVTVIPRYIVSDALRAGLLFELYEPAERKLNTLYIAHRDEPLSSVQQRLITCLCDAARGWQECPEEGPGASSNVSANGGDSAPGGTGSAVTARIRKQPKDPDHA